MATFTSASAFANHVAGYGKKVEDSQPRAVKAAAEVAGIAIRQAGYHFHIRGRTGKKWKLGAKVTGPYGFGGNVLAYVDADPAGFWHLVEHGARAHWIGPRGVTQGRRQRRGQRGAHALFASGYDHPYARPVHHPGTGSLGHPWAAGVAVASRTAPLVFEREVVSVFGMAA